jgi:DNA-binding MarR family transcriptional regulator
MSRPLSLEQQVIAALRKITRAIDLHSRRLLKQCGLTSPQLAALQAVERLQPITVGALAQEIHLGQATLTGILRRLEDRGLVTRNRGDRDRRSVLVTLSSAGREILQKSPSPLQERFHRELSKLQEWEQTQILATLQRIASMMDAGDIEAAPLLLPGVASASAEDVSRYLERAVVPTDDAPLAEERSEEAVETLSEQPKAGTATGGACEAQ